MGEKKEKKKDKKKEKKDKEKKKEEKATVRSAPDGSDNDTLCQGSGTWFLALNAVEHGLFVPSQFLANTKIYQKRCFVVSM